MDWHVYSLRLRVYDTPNFFPVMPIPTSIHKDCVFTSTLPYIKSYSPECFPKKRDSDKVTEIPFYIIIIKYYLS